MFVKQNKYIQTEFNMSLTEKELDLLVEIQKYSQKLNERYGGVDKVYVEV